MFVFSTACSIALARERAAAAKMPQKKPRVPSAKEASRSPSKRRARSGGAATASASSSGGALLQQPSVTSTATGLSSSTVGAGGWNSSTRLSSRPSGELVSALSPPSDGPGSSSPGPAPPSPLAGQQGQQHGGRFRPSPSSSSVGGGNTRQGRQAADSGDAAPTTLRGTAASLSPLTHIVLAEASASSGAPAVMESSSPLESGHVAATAPVSPSTPCPQRQSRGDGGNADVSFSGDAAGSALNLTSLLEAIPSPSGGSAKSRPAVAMPSLPVSTATSPAAGSGSGSSRAGRVAPNSTAVAAAVSAPGPRPSFRDVAPRVDTGQRRSTTASSSSASHARERSKHAAARTSIGSGNLSIPTGPDTALPETQSQQAPVDFTGIASAGHDAPRTASPAGDTAPTSPATQPAPSSSSSSLSAVVELDPRLVSWLEATDLLQHATALAQCFAGRRSRRRGSSSPAAAEGSSSAAAVLGVLVTLDDVAGLTSQELTSEPCFSGLSGEDRAALGAAVKSLAAVLAAAPPSSAAASTAPSAPVSHVPSLSSLASLEDQPSRIPRPAGALTKPPPISPRPPSTASAVMTASLAAADDATAARFVISPVPMPQEPGNNDNDDNSRPVSRASAAAAAAGVRAMQLASPLPPSPARGTGAGGTNDGIGLGGSTGQGEEGAAQASSAGASSGESGTAPASPPAPSSGGVSDVSIVISPSKLRQPSAGRVKRASSSAPASSSSQTSRPEWVRPKPLRQSSGSPFGVDEEETEARLAGGYSPTAAIKRSSRSPGGRREAASAEGSPVVVALTTEEGAVPAPSSPGGGSASSRQRQQLKANLPDEARGGSRSPGRKGASPGGKGSGKSLSPSPFPVAAASAAASNAGRDAERVIAGPFGLDIVTAGEVVRLPPPLLPPLTMGDDDEMAAGFAPSASGGGGKATVRSSGYGQKVPVPPSSRRRKAGASSAAVVAGGSPPAAPITSAEQAPSSSSTGAQMSSRASTATGTTTTGTSPRFRPDLKAAAAALRRDKPQPTEAALQQLLLRTAPNSASSSSGVPQLPQSPLPVPVSGQSRVASDWASSFRALPFSGTTAQSNGPSGVASSLSPSIARFKALSAALAQAQFPQAQQQQQQQQLATRLNFDSAPAAVVTSSSSSSSAFFPRHSTTSSIGIEFGEIQAALAQQEQGEEEGRKADEQTSDDGQNEIDAEEAAASNVGTAQQKLNVGTSTSSDIDGAALVALLEQAQAVAAAAEGDGPSSSPSSSSAVEAAALAVLTPHPQQIQRAATSEHRSRLQYSNAVRRGAGGGGPVGSPVVGLAAAEETITDEPAYEGASDGPSSAGISSAVVGSPSLPLASSLDDALADWLMALGLYHHADAFAAAGVRDLRRASKLSPQALEGMAIPLQDAAVVMAALGRASALGTPA